MPGFDGTGPAGMGPMTGGARGFCNPAGMRWAGAYRFSRRPSYSYPYYHIPAPFYGANMSREQEAEYLTYYANDLRRMLEGIDERIEQLAKEGS